MARKRFDNVAEQPHGRHTPLNTPSKYYLDLCRQGKSLQAVKEYKEDQGCSLKEAKDYIDNLRVQNGLAQPSKGSGCMVILVLAVILTSALFFI